MSQFLNLENMFVDGVGEYGFPEIEGRQTCPDMRHWIEFDYAKRTTKDRGNTGIHFYEWDDKFQRVWAQPNSYLNLLKQFGLVIMPDFSMYRDFPKAIQIFNKYRNHWLAAYWQMNGIQVIPDIGWSTPDNYDWQFDGYPKNSIVSVSTVGCLREKEAKELFIQGWNEMLKRLEPKEILLFTNSFNIELDGNIHFIRHILNKEDQR